jgi:acyl-coenzyme A thioesterase PaaI-like protein
VSGGQADAGPLPMDGSIFGPDQPCFGCGPAHPIGFRLRFEKGEDELGAFVRTRFVPGDRYQGPPGILHGGLVMTVADEIAAWTIIGLHDKFGFTAAFDGRLRGPVRIGEEVVGTGRVAADRRRIMDLAVELKQADALVFTGSFRFAILDESAAERMLGQPLPEAWKRFSRD